MRLFGRIPRERVAGVVIDMQGESYLNGHDSGSVDKMVQSQISVLDYFASNNIPVVNFRNRFQLKDTGPVLPEILEVVGKNSKPKNLVKESNSGFTNSLFEDHLSECNRDHLILMGVNAYACVKETAEDALKKGYRFSVSWDLVGNPKNISQYDSFSWFFWNSHCFTRDYRRLLEKIK
jgi:nicotinamidase-related amidase